MPEAERQLSERLGLHWDAQMQDWDLNNSNAELLPECFATLADSKLSNDELYALMELTIASVEEAQSNLDGENHWKSIEAVLRRRPDLYASAMVYWAQPALDGLDAGRQFYISKHMALLWSELLPDLITNYGCQLEPVASIS